MLQLCISGISSNSGKTTLTTALLYHFKKSVRPFKIGPDYIDPQFHTKICQTPSINLDSFIMDGKQVQWLYENYSDKKVSIVEGVMGFYDGEDRGCSAYSVTKLLDIPTILILDGSGSYITISAVLKGLLEYKNDNTIQAVVLNHIASQGHFELIRDILNRDHKEIVVLGWIHNNLHNLHDTHLGLDLEELDKVEMISKDVLQHIDLTLLENVAKKELHTKLEIYPFDTIEKQNKHLAIVTDENFSFLYHDNLVFLKEIFQTVTIVKSTKDEIIPNDADSVYICGGYVESEKAYARVKDSTNFKNSLIEHSKTKKIYAECAGLLYLGNRVDAKKMSGIVDVDFTLCSRFTRLGYYYNEANIKGHSFHYTKPLDDNCGFTKESRAFDVLSKELNGVGEMGSWANKTQKVFGTYLHTMFRNNISLVKDKF